MIKESPNVIFKSKYLLALNSIDNKFHNKDKRLKDVDEMLDYFSNEKKKVVGMFEYYMGHTRGDNINLVMEDGSYATKEDLKIIKNNYKRYIESFGVTVYEARLMSWDETKYFPGNLYSILCNTSFWTGSASSYDEGFISCILTGNRSGAAPYSSKYWAGIKPVIVI